MPEADLVKKNITAQQLKNSFLSIQASLNGLSFSVMDTNRLMVIAYRKYRFENTRLIDELTEKIQDLLNKDSLLNNNYQQVGFIYLSQKSTLIPSAYFDENSLRKYFEFNHTLNELDEIHYNYIYAIDAYNVFTIPNYVANEVYNKYKNISFYHQATPLINGIYTREKSNKETEIYINLNEGFFDIAVINSGKLNLYNSFSCQNENDILYFIMYVVKQLKIDPDNAILCLSGIHADDKHIITFRKFLPTITSNSPNAKFIYAKALADIPKNTFTNLINLYSCE